MSAARSLLLLLQEARSVEAGGTIPVCGAQYARALAGRRPSAPLDPHLFSAPRLRCTKAWGLLSVTAAINRRAFLRYFHVCLSRSFGHLESVDWFRG
jgi:hypothetical protein